MKNIILAITIMVVGMVGVNAQTTQTANEGYVGYSYLRQNVAFNETPVVRYNADTDSQGITAGATHYFGATANKVGVLGVSGDVTANFTGNGNSASLVTGLVGITAKARNYSYVQPYVRVLGGLARQNVTRSNIKDNTDISATFDFGTGVAINLARDSRYKIQFGADLVNTGFHDERQNGLRLSTSIVF